MAPAKLNTPPPTAPPFADLAVLLATALSSSVAVPHTAIPPPAAVTVVVLTTLPYTRPRVSARWQPAATRAPPPHRVEWPPVSATSISDTALPLATVSTRRGAAADAPASRTARPPASACSVSERVSSNAVGPSPSAIDASNLYGTPLVSVIVLTAGSAIAASSSATVAARCSGPTPATPAS